MYCLQGFSSDDVLNNHETYCKVINGKQAIKMPDKDNNILKFHNFHEQLAVPFLIYSDFEAVTENVQGCQSNNDKSYTEVDRKHKDCGFGYKVVCPYNDKYSKPAQIYRGENALHKFMEKMLEVQWCRKITKKRFNKLLIMSDEDEENFKKADKCHICDKKHSQKDIRVRDHCHITGKYRGYAHQDRNLKLKIKPEEIEIPVIFHNLEGYDSHFIMQEISQIAKKHTYKNKKGEEQQMDINAIKYMAFMLGKHLVFLDSFQFMSSSLGKLCSKQSPWSSI